MPITRAQAWELLNQYVKSPLLKHCLAVESAMRAYALKYNENQDLWGICGLVHDLDYEQFPDKHPFKGVEILKENNYPDEIITAILGHATYSGVERQSLMAKCLFGVDELCGFVMACGYVRPEKLHGMTPESVNKKLKKKEFARQVSREEIAQGIKELGVNENDHIALVIFAMLSISDRLYA